MNWDLTVLYKDFSDPAYQRDVESISALTQKLNSLFTADLDPQALLEEAVSITEALASVSDDTFSYTYLVLSTDATNPAAAQALDKLMALSIEVQLAQSAFTRYIGKVDNLDEVIAQSKVLPTYAFILQEMKDQCAHLIPEALESWMLRMSLSGGVAFSQLRDKLDATHTVNYRGNTLPLPAVRAMAHDGDAAVRKDAYEAEIASYQKVELPMSYCLNSIKGEGQTMAEVKGYESVLDWMLDTSRMDKETLDAMWTAVKEALPAFRRYMQAKAKLLGHKNGLPFYDLFAPVGKGGTTYTAQAAKEKLITAMSKFNPEVGTFIATAFDDNWIDMYPKEGKSGGAFCSRLHRLDVSRILTNFAGSFSDVSTLCHELGHAWHNRCLAGLPHMLIDTPMPLAETASIFNETMLTHQVLQEASPDEAFTILESSIMEATQTVVDIYSRFLFESQVIEQRKDHTLSADDLKQLMLDAQAASYGDGLDPDVRHPYMWACKSHYYSSGFHFYNFPYCFGLLFGKGVFAQYLKEGDSFIPKYNQLLRNCGNAKVADVAASVGIDVRTVDFWRSSLDLVVQEIDQFIQLCQA